VSEDGQPPACVAVTPRKVASLSMLAAAMATVGVPVETELAPDRAFQAMRRGREARARELEELDRREAAARAWVKPPTPPPEAPRCPAGPACAQLECALHGPQLRKRARRAARAAPRPAPEPRAITMPAGRLPGVLGETILQEEVIR
jgi:hypothetical protein